MFNDINLTERHYLAATEIVKLEPDVICLQEVLSGAAAYFSSILRIIFVRI